MIVRPESDRLVIDAPSKVNLHLEILGKRSDGYHELETLMVSISLCDTLEFRELPSGTTLRCSDPSVGEGDDNLVMRAVHLTRQESGCQRGIAIDLTKRIPVAAGLAGGSSDAAATLAGLNQLWDLQWSHERLAELASRLGSDIPFFFDTPAAICRGRGEKVTPCPMGTTLHLVVIAPKSGLSTKAVYQQLQVPAVTTSVEPIRLALEKGDAETVATMLHNRLEDVSLRLNPEVAELKRRAATWPCLGHLMSGSGSAYFAICHSFEQAQDLGAALQSQDLGSVFVVRSSH